MKKIFSVFIAIIFVVLTVSGCGKIKSDKEYILQSDTGDNLTPDESVFNFENKTYELVDNEYMTLQLITYKDFSTGENMMTIKAIRKSSLITSVVLSNYVFNGSMTLTDYNNTADILEFTDSDEAYVLSALTPSNISSLSNAVASDTGWDKITSVGCHVNAVSGDGYTYDDESSVWYGDVAAESESGFEYDYICLPYMGALAKRQTIGTIDDVEITLVALGNMEFKSDTLTGLVYMSNSGNSEKTITVDSLEINGMTFEAHNSYETIPAGKSLYSSFYIDYDDIKDYVDGIESVSVIVWEQKNDFSYAGGGEACRVALSQTGTNTIVNDPGITILEDEYIRIGFIRTVDDDSDDCVYISIENLSDSSIIIDLLEMSPDGSLKTNSNFYLSPPDDTISARSTVFRNITRLGMWEYEGADNEEYVKGRYEGTFVLHVTVGNYSYNTESFTITV